MNRMKGDNSIKLLRLLLVELRVTLQRIRGEPVMRTESKETSLTVLKKKVLLMLQKKFSGIKNQIAVSPGKSMMVRK